MTYYLFKVCPGRPGVAFLTLLLSAESQEQARSVTNILTARAGSQKALYEQHGTLEPLSGDKVPDYDLYYDCVAFMNSVQQDQKLET